MHRRTRVDPSGGYDRLAASYRTLERLAFGGALMRARLRHLAALDGAERVLVIGEGDGRFVAALCRRNRRCRPTVIERSGAMIALAQARLEGDTARVRFVQGDVRDLDVGGERFDAVVTHFVLDLFGPGTLDALIPRLASTLTPQGVWLLADFALPERGPGRWRAHAWLILLYALFRLRTDQEATRLHDPGASLTAAGLTPDRVVELQMGLLRTAVWRREEPGRPPGQLIHNPEHFTPMN
jgi:ubiquinone/menaquinone biosynthesis C-methylase UbiE